MVFLISAAILFGALSRFVPDALLKETAWLEQAVTWGIVAFLASFIFNLKYNQSLKKPLIFTVCWLILACLSYEGEYLLAEAGKNGLGGAWYEFIHNKLALELGFSVIIGTMCSLISFLILRWFRLRKAGIWFLKKQRRF